MTSGFAGRDEVANEILEGVSRGRSPFHCLETITSRGTTNPVSFIHALVSLGVSGGDAMAIVTSLQSQAAHLSPPEINRLVLEAIETTNLTGSTDHHSKVQEKTP